MATAKETNKYEMAFAEKTMASAKCEMASATYEMAIAKYGLGFGDTQEERVEVEG